MGWQSREGKEDLKQGNQAESSRNIIWKIIENLTTWENYMSSLEDKNGTKSLKVVLIKWKHYKLIYKQLYFVI